MPPAHGGAAWSRRCRIRSADRQLSRAVQCRGRAGARGRATARPRSSWPVVVSSPPCPACPACRVVVPCRSPVVGSRCRLLRGRCRLSTTPARCPLRCPLAPVEGCGRVQRLSARRGPGGVVTLVAAPVDPAAAGRPAFQRAVHVKTTHIKCKVIFSHSTRLADEQQHPRRSTPTAHDRITLSVAVCSARLCACHGRDRGSADAVSPPGPTVVIGPPRELSARHRHDDIGSCCDA
jgi:hypothetical protein